MRLALFALSVSAPALISVPTLAQNIPGVQCIANVGVPPTIRVEGLTELVGDVVLKCSGGVPTPLGLPVPTYNVILQLNTSVTNPLTLDGASDALLLIDEPHAGPTSPPINFTPTPAPTLLGTGDGKTTYGFGRPNVFQGRAAPQQNAGQFNSVTWNGVPLDPPGTTTNRTIRITNTRVNANQLGTSSTLIPTQVVAVIEVTGSPSITINNPNQAVAVIQPALTTGVTQSFTQSACTPANAPFTASPNALQSFIVRLRETFSNSFKTRSTSQGTSANRLPAAATQDVPGQNVAGSELGFTLPQIDSQVSFGTQFLLFVNGVPQNVDLWFPALVGVNSHIVAIDKPGGQRTAVPPTVGNFFKVPLVNGSGSIFYEMSDQNAQVNETFDIQAFVSYVSGGAANNSPPPGTATVNLSFAPLGPVAEPHVPNGATSRVIPRFVDYPSFDNQVNQANPFADRLGIFTLTPCGANQALSGVLPPGSPSGRMSFTAAAQDLIPPAQQNFIGTSTRDNVTGVGIIPTASNNFVPGTVPEDAGRSATSNWLTVETTGSATPLTGRVSVNPVGLAPGKYAGSIAFGSAAAGNVTVPVDLTVTGPLPSFIPAAVTSAGSYASNLVTPGEAVVIFGTRFGPPVLAGLDFSGGQVATLVGQTRVLFDGVPAPMIYAVNGQVSAFVPYSVAGNLRTQIQIEYQGVKSNPVFVPVIKAVPALLTSDSSGFGQAAALNQDSSVNLPAKPESVGNQVVLFGVGGGQTTPAGRDGRLNGVGATLPTFNMAITSVTINGKAAEVKYAGPAPGAVEGVFQVNVVIPPGTPSGPASVVVFFGDYVTQLGVTISVK